YCVISSGPLPVARPLYRKMKQDTEGLARVGINGVFGPLNWQGKHVFDLREVFPNAAMDMINIKAVLLPKVSHLSQTVIEPTSAFEALQALAPSTMLQLGGDRAATFKACADVVRAVPAYHLLLGEDPCDVTKAVKDFISGVSQ
ncbi:MAG: hypothetical protein L3J33_12025, partial [Rhodobacteraceae bacterium]|nr:hypothetical protein [Paracoccaceae bacterium]